MKRSELISRLLDAVAAGDDPEVEMWAYAPETPESYGATIMTVGYKNDVIRLTALDNGG